MKLSIVTASSPVGHVELAAGLSRLRAESFDLRVNPQTLERSFLFAGTDESRAQAILDAAHDPETDVVWCARGGYGAGRVVGLLDRMSRDLGASGDLAAPRQKLLVGYSDVTVLHEFVRNRWGWKTLHGVMPASDWTKVEPDALRATFDLVKRNRPTLKYESTPLWWIEGPPPRDVTGELIGGNLSLVHTLAGTPYEYEPTGKILFLEDIGEKIYAIDRYVVQMEQAGMFDGLAAIVLGDFTDCRDEDNTMQNPDQAARSAGGPERVSLRPTFSLETGLSEIFGRIARERGIPLARGLPVGHGPNFWPLPLGARYTLTRSGLLKLDAWDWLTASRA